MSTYTLNNYYHLIDKYKLHHALGGTAYDGGLEQNRYELNCLCQFINENNIKTWLEIGIAKGFLLRFMRDEMQLQVTGITPLYADYEKSGHIGLDVIYGYSQDAAVITQVKKYDMIFVDGDHSYESVKADYNNYKDKATYIAFHDACGLRGCDGVKKLLDEHNPRWLFADDNDFKSGIAIL